MICLRYGVLLFLLTLSSIIASMPVEAQTIQLETDVYFGMNSGADDRCGFQEGQGCELFKITLQVVKNESGVQSVTPIPGSLVRVLPDNVPSITAGLSEDGRLIGFMAADNRTTGAMSFKAGNLYVYDSDTQAFTWITNGANTQNSSGAWIKFLTDSTYVYTKANYCQGQNTAPGCGTSQTARFDDLRIGTANFMTGTVVSDDIVFGDVNPLTHLDSRDCSSQDPVVHPINRGMVAFHSTSVDGYSFNNFNNPCPFNRGQTNIFHDQNGNADPKPVVFDLESASPDNTMDGLVEGQHYWLFDLDAAQINSLVHLNWSPDGAAIVGNEQNTDVFSPYVECLDNPGVQVNSANQCGSRQKAVSFERVYGFEKDGATYKNVRRDVSPTLPLFSHKAPAHLPGSASFLNASTDTVTVYRTKYVEYCGSNSSIAATVMGSFIRGGSNVNVFSRIMYIDFTDPSNPYYFDVTGHVEENYPEWQGGQALGFSTTCRAVSEKVVTSREAAPQRLPDALGDVSLYPNPATTSVNIDSARKVGIKRVAVFNSLGRLVADIGTDTGRDVPLPADMKSGLYFIHVSYQDGSSVIRKFVVQK